MRRLSKNLLYSFLLAWVLLLSSLMFLGTYSQARIGTITWGPTTDIWAMSIAISHLKFGLKGGLGYRGVTNELSKHLTISQNEFQVMDPGTKELLNNPIVVTSAIRAAANTPIHLIHSGPIDPNHYVTTFAEDIGYAHFYETAFRLFGFHAFSSHYLYFSILLLSLFICLIGFYRDKIALIVMIISVSSLFLISSSILFSLSVPTFATNRYLSTLAIIPFLHVLLYISKITKPTKRDFICFSLQLLLFAFTINIRSSAYWMIITLLATTAFLTFYQYRIDAKQIGYSQKSFLQSEIVRQILKGTLLTLAVLLSYNCLVNLNLHKVYSKDDVSSHHMRWHSAYIGLTIHPGWYKRMPYPELANHVEDGIAFTIYDIYRRKYPNIYKLSSVSNGFKIKLHERLMRKEFFSFVWKHPGYVAMLIFYYKPLLLIHLYKQIITGIPLIVWLLTLIGLIMGAFYIKDTIKFKSGLGLMTVAGIVWLTSLVPLLITYPGSHVMSDQAWSFMAFLLCGFVLGLVYVLKIFSWVTIIIVGRQNYQTNLSIN